MFWRGSDVWASSSSVAEQITVDQIRGVWDVVTTGAHPLTEAEVAERIADGRINVKVNRVSRSVSSILKSNILTRFNAIITVMLVVILVYGHPVDALFGIVMVLNALIGIVQELRAKHTLERLTVLIQPTANVRRESGTTEIPTTQIVLDDVMDLSRGFQIPVDGRVVTSKGLEVSEALLTGEAHAISKTPGDTVLSGSFVVAGTGRCVVTAVGPDAYAQRLAAEAQEFTLARSEVAAAIDRILRLVTYLLIPISALLLWSQIQAGHGVSAAAVSTVAGVVAMVPQGLVLLVSMAFAVAVVRLGASNVLVQELSAVETLARVDVLCVDKTGTLTNGTIALDKAVPLRTDDIADDVRVILGRLAGADEDPNPTMVALGDAFPAVRDVAVDGRIAFSSDRRMSAVAFEDGTAWVVGAPDAVGGDAGADLQRLVDAASTLGHRTVLVASADHESVIMGEPTDVTPVILLEFAEVVRPDASQTVAYFKEQGVDLRVISGDSSDTVAAVAKTAGVAVRSSIDAASLPSFDDPAFADRTVDVTVFGRVSPEQKRHLVESFQTAGHVVAMTGDGVNDVLALKAADLGIAMGTGSSATRAVAQLVLLDDKFASLPTVVAEGRRVVANMERVAALFLTKTVYAALLAVLIGFVGLAFPFLPRHMTLVGSLTIGIPAFYLSFEPRQHPIRKGFLQRAFAFSIPAGLVTGFATFLLYGVSRTGVLDMTLAESRSTATSMMVVLGLVVLYKLIAPANRQHLALIAGLFISYVVVLAVPQLRDVFDLVVPTSQAWLAILGASLVAGVVLTVLVNASRKFVAERYGVEPI